MLFAQRFAPLRRRVTGLFVAAMVALSAPVAFGQRVSLIQDAEIESMISAFAQPILKAAGMGRTQVRIVNDRRFNAFIDDTGTIYIYTGMIIDIENPRELKAVLAHEIAHLAGGDVNRIRSQMENAARIQAATMLLGLGLMAASAAGDGTQALGGAASTLIMASQSALQNNLMAFRRSEESAADAAAVRFLTAAGQSTKGVEEILNTMLESQSLRAAAASYLATHPIAQDRINQVVKAARASPTYNRADTGSEIRMLAMAQAKIVGYLEPARTVRIRYPNSDRTLPARYARVIAGYRAGAGPGAVAAMANLVAEQRSNPYFQELYGQMFLETGQAVQSIGPLRRAVELAPDKLPIRVLYGHALVEAGGAANLQEAVRQLGRASRQPNPYPRVFRLLARAHAGLGNVGQADLAAAEAAFLAKDLPLARALAGKAREKLKNGSPGWLRADDILAITS
ncbi:MAG: M48 family metalloprotease [Alphaproteobacteria bacterium]|nr:M48 family metalloprotease [Alphaproteobacteria bacterium]